MTNPTKRRRFRKQHATARRILWLWTRGRIHLSRIRIWQLRQRLRSHHSNDPNLFVRTTTRAMTGNVSTSWTTEIFPLGAVGQSEISLLRTLLAILGRQCSKSFLSTSLSRIGSTLAISRVWILAGFTSTTEAKISEEKIQNP